MPKETEEPKIKKTEEIAKNMDEIAKNMDAKNDHRKTEENAKYVWQQDSAPAHKAKVVQDWCKSNLKDFWPANIWPPSSPDCAVLDFAIWGIVEREACSTPHPMWTA